MSAPPNVIVCLMASVAGRRLVHNLLEQFAISTKVAFLLRRLKQRLSYRRLYRADELTALPSWPFVRLYEQSSCRCRTTCFCATLSLASRTADGMTPFLRVNPLVAHRIKHHADQTDDESSVFTRCRIFQLGCLRNFQSLPVIHQRTSRQ